jgi:hypothetical protein
MAVWSWQDDGSTWADTTEQSVCTTACRITKIEIEPNGSQSAIAYLDLWDAADPTPAITTPTLRIPIQTNTVRGLQRKLSVVLPNGGIRFGTACTVFCSSDGGATAPLTTVIPQEIRIFYAPGI